MNKKILLLIIIINFCVISSISAADNLTDDVSDCIQVGQNDDCGFDLENDGPKIFDDDKLGEVNAGYRDIQNKIDSASEGDVINISGEYVCDYLINVNKSVTINGIDNATIRYNGTNEYQTPFFNVNASNVVLKNIKFIGGTFLYGGAITWLGDNGVITIVNFQTIWLMVNLLLLEQYSYMEIIVT